MCDRGGRVGGLCKNFVVPPSLRKSEFDLANKQPRLLKKERRKSRDP
jgi:hypothetical protein